MIGQIISHYKILEKLGEGGMGVVYKAQDTKLDRFVALKFLPAHLAASEQDKARFIQEAKSAAALNHPNVCSIIDIQEHDGQIFIVMEFVDGQTLQEKKSSLSQKQAIDYGIQIAEGLAAAHEKGIVHRDIKPENIMVRKDGIVQIMDFGLAKLVGVSRLTKIGSTVGTLGYMSPEQVQGQETDHRSDIFSFGVLLYELLTGKSPFNGAHESAILYEVVNVDVQPPSSVKPEIDLELDRIVLECMEKDPNERMQSVKQVAIDLNRFKRTSSRTRMSRTFSSGSFSKVLQPSETTGFINRSILSSKNIPWFISVFVIASVLVWNVFFTNSDGHREVNRLNISVINSPDQIISRAEVPTFSLSPDGRFLAYTLFEKGVSQIYLKPLNSFQGVSIAGTINGIAPFFSPDGKWIAFLADGKLKKIPTQGGSVETICEANGFRGAWWSSDELIYISPTFASGIMSVSSKGGELKTVSILDTTNKERTHRWPQVLPDGKHVLYTVGDINSPNSYVDAPIVIQSIATGERHKIDVRGEMARYIEPGYLIVARNGTLFAAPFSLNDFRITQQFVPVITDVNSDQGSGVTDFSVSGNGHLVYLQGTFKKELELVWVDLKGNITPVLPQMQPFSSPRVSPDGTKLAVTIGTTVGNDNDVWIYDLKNKSFSRLTFGKKMFAPVWSHDSKTIFYAGAAAGNAGLWEHPADGSGDEKSIYNMMIPHYPVSVSANGKYFIINTEGGFSDGDIVMMDLEKKSEPTPLLNTSFYESGGYVSPDGKFIVSYSNETGVFEVFVRSFPHMKGKWQISSNGGVGPCWSPDGKTIYYVSPLGKMMAVNVRTALTFSADQAQEIFDITPMFFPNNPIANYDITPDGKKFVMIRNTTENTKVSSFNIILNLSEEFEKLFNK